MLMMIYVIASTLSQYVEFQNTHRRNGGEPRNVSYLTFRLIDLTRAEKRNTLKCDYHRLSLKYFYDKQWNRLHSLPNR